MLAVDTLLTIGTVLLALFTLIFILGSLNQLARWLKPVAVVASLFFAGVAAIAISDHAVSALHAIATPAEQVAEAAPVAAANPAVAPLSAEIRLAPAASEMPGPASGGPRECSPSQGIETDCTYN
jgi:hypothetical protein